MTVLSVNADLKELLDSAKEKALGLKNRLRTLSEEGLYLETISEFSGDSIEDKVDRASYLVFKASSAMVKLGMFLCDGIETWTCNRSEIETKLITMIEEASAAIKALDLVIQNDKTLS